MIGTTLCSCLLALLGDINRNFYDLLKLFLWIYSQFMLICGFVSDEVQDNTELMPKRLKSNWLNILLKYYHEIVIVSSKCMLI